MSPNRNYKLKLQDDTELLNQLKILVSDERMALQLILEYIKEVEHRRLHLKRGYSSLFAFCTEELGYSESAAQRRIEAARLMRQLPEVKEKIITGKLTLSVVSQLAVFVRKENRLRKDSQLSPMSLDEKKTILAQVEGASKRECEKALLKISPEACLPPDKIRGLSEDIDLIQFNAGVDFSKKLQRLKELLAHQCPQGRLEDIIGRALDIALQKLEPKRKTKKPLPLAEVKPIKKPTQRKRYISAPIRQEVWLRDKACCQYKDQQTGRRCQSRHGLEVDHILPWALGGCHDLDNLQLLCRSHNQLRAQESFNWSVSSQQ